jgi:uncharacterized Fe-S cluster-containing radical SAM superfamily protein
MKSFNGFSRGTLSLGPTCNNRCIFCFYAGERGRPDLTTREAFAEIEKAREMISGDILTFSGGEPTIRPDILRLCAHAQHVGFEGVNIQTNARALRDPNLVKAFVRNGLRSCFVSFHADSASLYARLTGSRKGFSQALAGLRNLEKHGIAFTVNVVITRLNFRRLMKTYLFLKRNLSSLRSLRLSYPRITGAALANFEKVVPRFAQISPYVRAVLKLARRDGVEALCDLLPTCVLGRYCDADIARQREPFYISDRAIPGPLGLDYSMKYGFCVRCAAVPFCCGIPLEYARRLPYRKEFHPFTHHVSRFTLHAPRFTPSGKGTP